MNNRKLEKFIMKYRYLNVDRVSNMLEALQNDDELTEEQKLVVAYVVGRVKGGMEAITDMFKDFKGLRIDMGGKLDGKSGEMYS
jgi:DNA-directed RNA polymerase subunit F